MNLSNLYDQFTNDLAGSIKYDSQQCTLQVSNKYLNCQASIYPLITATDNITKLLGTLEAEHKKDIFPYIYINTCKQHEAPRNVI